MNNLQSFKCWLKFSIFLSKFLSFKSVSPRNERQKPYKIKILEFEGMMQKGIESPSVDNYSFSGAGSSSFAGGYFTRAKKAWLMAKGAGLEFPGSDEDAIRGLEEELREAGYTGY